MDSETRKVADAVDGDRLWRRLMAMATIGATAAGGVNRQALSPEDRAARRRLVEWAWERGYDSGQDGAANLFLRRLGSEPDAAPVLIGSHLDSQPKGGRFDGAFGVLAAFEVLEALDDAGIATRRPVEVVAWTNEEGSRFNPGAMGSAVFARRMSLDEILPVVDWDGVPLADALRDTLADLPEVPMRERGLVPAAFLETHIEQGPRLEAEGIPVGVVTGIQGISNFQVEVIGAEAHAGTTPRKLRRDALKTAAAMVVALEEALADPEDSVRFTVGRFDVTPGSPNTVPGHVRFTIDFRHPDPANIERLTGRIEPVCRELAGACEVRVHRKRDVAPTQFDSATVDLLRESAEGLGIAHMDMFSGAGHDAMHLAAVCPTAMVFAPCKDGISHNEAESAKPADLAAATRVLAAATCALAQRQGQRL
jgi:beta-ureidopropionase / N-carbamoyl-L-amino-acid hydrolase